MNLTQVKTKYYITIFFGQSSNHNLTMSYGNIVDIIEITDFIINYEDSN